MNRRAFLGACAAASSLPLVGAVQSTPDTGRALRVLLGTGNPVPTVGGGFEFGGRTYRGTFSRSSDGSVINTVELEEYLYSVVPREMPPQWPMAALQAQAICARTFVLAHADPQRAYDVVPSSLNQVYEGVGTESPAGRDAVDATAGSVLRYGNALAQIAYSACCGGHTESAADAWGGVTIPYLAGVRCPYCTASPYYRWVRDLPFGAIARALSASLKGSGTLRDVRLGTADASGRARYFELITDAGTAIVHGSEFRIRVGASLVPSLLISRLSVEPPEGELTAPLVHLEGSGNGHGVGLCQWGARGMALASASLRQVLAYYFPGTAIDAWTNVPAQPTTTSFRPS